MFDDLINDSHNTFSLRVDFYGNDGVRLVTLIPSYQLEGKTYHTNEDKLPEFITKPISVLKMLGNGERIELVGKKLNEQVFYVYVHVDTWKTFLWTDQGEKSELFEYEC